MTTNLVLRSPTALVRERGYGVLLRASIAITGLGAALALIFDDSLARAGLTSGSILLFAVLILFAVDCGKDPLHPARLLAVLLALGFVIGPMVHAATGFYALPDGSARQRADLSRATWVVLAGATLGMLAMRAVLGRDWRTDLRSVTHPSINRRAVMAASGVAIVGAAFFAAYLLLIGVSSVSLQGRGASYAAIPNEGRRAYLELLAPVALGGLLIIAARALERRARLTLFVAAIGGFVFGAIMALPGSRANFLYAIAPLFFVYAGYKGLPRRRWLLVAAVALVVGLTYGTSLRSADVRANLIRNPWHTLVTNRPTPDSIKRFFLIDVAHTEPLLGAMDAYPATRPFLGGESAAIGFTGPPGYKFARSIGLAIDPPAGVTFTAAAYGRDPSTFDAGLTATLPGELYANAGVPGVIFGLAGFGAIAGMVRRRAISSPASGAVALYAAEITILFAIFADYFGQFYRGGAILLGAALSLILGGERRFAFSRAAAVACLIALSATVLLVARRIFGDPPAAVLTSMAPAYATFVALGMFFTIQANRHLRTELAAER